MEKKRKKSNVETRTNIKVFLLAVALVLCSVGVVAFRVIYGGYSIFPEEQKTLWHVEIVMHAVGTGEAGKVKLYLPHDTGRQLIYNSHFDSDGLDFTVEDKGATGNSVGIWRSMVFEGVKRLQYEFSVQAKEQEFAIPVGLALPDKPLEAYPPEMHMWLSNSEFIQMDGKALNKKVKALVSRKKTVDVAVKRIYDYIRDDVKYKSEEGSKDSRTALEALEADCGGKARLFVAMSRNLGIPSRVVGGIILDDSVKKISHVWVENYIGGQWIPFDVVNGHYGSIPDNYLEIYRGDNPLFKHKGITAFEWIFIIGKTNIPPVDNAWSLYVLPGHVQNMLNFLLLIPMGTLVIVFFRNIVGINTFGTFSPMLLAIAFSEISPEHGAIILGIIFISGWILRKFLDSLKILFIPKLSIILSVVVILVLASMVAGFHLGERKLYYTTIFPMVIITWLIERFTVAQIEDGTKEAVRMALGTFFVGTALYYFINIHALQVYLFAFPELILVIIASLLIMGRYTGMRVMELWRFKELLKKHG